jgi:hypothetical protein
MSNVIDINELKDMSEWRLYAEGLFHALQKSEALNQDLTNKVNHLEELLTSSTHKLAPIPIEQLICELQIKKLYDKGMQSELSLEETKRLDLLVKNLYLTKGQATEIVSNIGAISDKVPDIDLIRVIKEQECP